MKILLWPTGCLRENLCLKHRSSLDKAIHALQWNKVNELWINMGNLVFFSLSLWFEPRHNKTNKVTVHPAKTDQPGHLPNQSLRCALNGYLRTQAFFMRTAKIDQTGRMPGLIWDFAGRYAILLFFSCRGSFSCWGPDNQLIRRLSAIFERVPFPYIKPHCSYASAMPTNIFMHNSSVMNAVSKQQTRAYTYSIFQVRQKLTR